MRHYKITNSYGVYDAYKAIRKQQWFNIERPLKEKEFYTIIRKCNALITSNLSKGIPFILPYRLGTLELRKSPKRIFIQDTQYQSNLPVDWKSTNALWAEDKEAAAEKLLVKYELNEIFRVLYNKSTVNYINKSFIKFRPIRSLKQELAKEISNGHLDAFLFKVKQ